MNKLTVLSLVLSCGLFAAGCGSSASTFSCDFKMSEGTTTTHECTEYDNLPSADDAAESSGCTTEMGTAGTGCSATDSLGSCAISLGGLDYKTFFYSDGGLTAAEAQMDCTAESGTWSAGG
jgi:hypothetical protein